MLKAAAAGLTVAETAERMGLGAETVRTYRRRILAILDAVNMTNAVGIAFATGILGEPQEEPADELISPGQVAAFHGKSSALDKACAQERGTAKREALDWLAGQLGREIESVNDLTRFEATRVLDHLEELLNS